MKRLMLLSSALVLLFSSQAFAQATAESALTNSAAGNAAAKTGSALGNSLGKAFDKSAQKLSESMQTPAQPAAQTTTPAPADANNAAPNTSAPQPTVTPDAALVHFSVTDIGTSCPAPTNWRSEDTAAPSTNNLTVCSLHASAKPFPKTKYKPVVDIKF